MGIIQEILFMKIELKRKRKGDCEFMIISIHQPDYIPYPGYFYKIAKCDCFVFLDDAQYSNVGFTNWNKIKTPQGSLRLKIPVEQTLGDTIQEVTTKDYLKWKEKHLKTLKMNYAKSKWFQDIYGDIEKTLLIEYTNIAELNIALILFICNKFGLSKKFVRSSSLGISSGKEERVINICHALGGSIYLSGNGARVYQVKEHFSKQMLELQYSDYHPIIYPQLWGDFLPDLSIIDFLFNHGYDWERVESQMRRA